MLIGMLCGLDACFTEVGNAEDGQLVKANFSIDYAVSSQPLPRSGAKDLHSIASPSPTLDSLIIQQLYLRVREAEYYAMDSTTGEYFETHLWKNPAGVDVDFTGKDAAATLPAERVVSLTADTIKLQFRLAQAHTLLTDTLDFDTFADRRYMKGIAYVGGKQKPFLFALPAARRVELIYSKEALEKWHSQEGYHCEFMFYGYLWAENPVFTKAKAWRDSNDKEVMIFDGNHNPAAYRELSTAFFNSFNTLKVEVRK